MTEIALTTRFTDGSFQHLGCVAEELALTLLLEQARGTLELFGLLYEGSSAALDSFAHGAYEDMDFEWLYDDSKDGIDEDAAAEALGIAPMALGSWFSPFNDGSYVHPYAVDDRPRAVRRMTAGGGVRLLPRPPAGGGHECVRALTINHQAFAEWTRPRAVRHAGAPQRP